MTNEEVDSIEVGDKVLFVATITDKSESKEYIQATIGDDPDWAFLPCRLKQGTLIKKRGEHTLHKGDIVKTSSDILAVVDKASAHGEFVHLDFEPKSVFRKADSLVLVMRAEEFEARMSALQEEGGADA